ncbi:MAG TPA: hypothetical protein VMG31_02905 [Verrucomicrobiae bacterium]|nr:hypothetical protein [Verrucomicrobiae bacterium]
MPFKPRNAVRISSAMMMLLCFPGFVLSQQKAPSTLAQPLHSEEQVGSVETNAGPQPSKRQTNADLPDSPGAVQLDAQNSWSERGSSPASSITASQDQTAESAGQPQLNQSAQSSQAQQPVGTAAAPAPTVVGNPAAAPAGVAVAPAKQRRVRIIVLKVGAIVGVAVALGTTLALAEATSSRPPGAH